MNTENHYTFVIHLNYTCNLTCDYCYQNDITEKKYMEKNIEDKIISFINEKIEKKKGIEVEVVFIGGEPLLYKDKIIKVMKKIRNKVKYSIVTNGTLLDYNFLNSLKELDIDHLFITLDGPKLIHDDFGLMSI